MNLHKIFQFLINDESFLTTETFVKNKKLNILPPAYKSYEFNSENKYTENCYRYGIINEIEHKDINVNISFLMSIMILLDRKFFLNIDVLEHKIYFNSFKYFITRKISRNYQIDKTRNTVTAKTKNQKINDSINKGIINHEVIQTIVNIFEINLLIIDLSDNKKFFFWSHGIKCAILNLFNPLFILSYFEGNYEPVISSKKHDKKNYINILLDNDMNYFEPIKINLLTTEYLSSWNISVKNFIDIINKYVEE